MQPTVHGELASCGRTQVIRTCADHRQWHSCGGNDRPLSERRLLARVLQPRGMVPDFIIATYN